jgi:hypothetical protein
VVSATGLVASTAPDGTGGCVGSGVSAQAASARTRRMARLKALRTVFCFQIDSSAGSRDPPS